MFPIYYSSSSKVLLTVQRACVKRLMVLLVFCEALKLPSGNNTVTGKKKLEVGWILKGTEAAGHEYFELSVHGQ